MPNHVTTGLTIASEDKDKLKELVKKTIKNNNTEFDFNGIIPSPDNKETGSCNREHEEGVICWYDWNIENWGTKWNAYNFKLHKLENNKVTVEFDTAWSEPVQIFEELENQGFLIGAVSIDEDTTREAQYYGNDQCEMYVNRNLEFWG